MAKRQRRTRPVTQAIRLKPLNNTLISRSLVVRSGVPRSARRAPVPGKKGRPRSRGETVRVTLDLRDAGGRPIRDPEMRFTFRRLSDNRQIAEQIQLNLAAVSPMFDLPAVAGDAIVCELDPLRYRFSHSPVFFRSPGPPLTRAATLLREPAAWSPAFTSWRELPTGFGDLKRALRASRQVRLFETAEVLGDRLTDDGYDDLRGPAAVLAKTALLNAYFRLSRANEPVIGTRSWFSFVRQIVAIGRERFLAVVDPEMETLVRQIDDHIGEFRANYERTPAENHRGNVPSDMRPRITEMVSIKSTHRKGNFQLTLSRLSNPDQVLLDADIDESGDLLGHFFDLFKHKLSGGTHPHDIHELLVLQEGQAEGFDLGYVLV